MSLENTHVIDAAGIEKATGITVLSILDAWDWENERAHLLALQDKINAYFEFVETGQLYESYPEAHGREMRIDVIGRYPIPATVGEFLATAARVASQLQIIDVTHRVEIGGEQGAPTAEK